MPTKMKAKLRPLQQRREKECEKERVKSRGIQISARCANATTNS